MSVWSGLERYAKGTSCSCTNLLASVPTMLPTMLRQKPEEHVLVVASTTLGPLKMDVKRAAHADALAKVLICCEAVAVTQGPASRHARRAPRLQDLASDSKSFAALLRTPPDCHSIIGNSYNNYTERTFLVFRTCEIVICQVSFFSAEVFMLCVMPRKVSMILFTITY